MIGNITRVIHSLLYVMTIHTYIQEENGNGTKILGKGDVSKLKQKTKKKRVAIGAACISKDD